MTQRISTPPKRYETYEGQKWVEDVRREVNLLQAADTAMDTRVDTAESDIDSLETRVTTAESGINSLKTRVTTAESDIDSLETRVTTAESDIDTLETNKVPYAGATGNVDLGTNMLTVDRVKLNASPGTNAVRELFWDAQEGVPSMMLDATAGVTMAIGTEVYLRGVNKTGVQINDGQVVYVSGAQGNRPKISLAKADSVGTSHVIGVATQNIANNAEGFVTIIGDVHGYNTSGFTTGDYLYLSASTAGALTNVAPSSPNNVVVVGTALNSTNNGTIGVHVHSGMAANTSLGTSNLIAPTQNAVKTYVDGVNYWSRSGTTVTPKTAADNVDIGTGYLVLSKATNMGIKVDSASPTFGWADITSDITAKNTGVSAPTWAVFRGALYAYKFTNGAEREAWINFHIPHDYVPGTDMYIHAHWAQATVDTGGTAGVPGVIQWVWDISYADGYGTAGGAADPFIAAKTIDITQQGSTTQYGHMIAEVQFTNNGGNSTHIDRNTIQVDGVIMARIHCDSGHPSHTLNQDPFLLFCDIHYQTNGVRGTKDKNYPFYT